MIDPLERPPSWCRSRWHGSDESVDWHNLMIEARNIFRHIYFNAFFGVPITDEALPIVPVAEPHHADAGHNAAPDDDGHEEAGVDVEAEPDLPDPSPEDSTFQRQSTYGANARAWFSIPNYDANIHLLKDLHGLRVNS